MKLRKCSVAAALVATFLCSATLPAVAAEVGGVKVEESTKVSGHDLVLNGAGVRYWTIIKVYTAGLYLGKKQTTLEGVLASTGPRRVAITMLRDATAEEFGQGFITGINANSDKAEKGKIVNQMAAFGELYSTIGTIKKGDVIHFDWIPEKGTTITINGKQVIEPIQDVAFYNAVLKMWLGEKPVDRKLKPALLGLETAPQG